MATPYLTSRVNGIVIPVPAHQAGILHRFDTPENRPIVSSTSQGLRRGEMQSMVIPPMNEGDKMLGSDNVPNYPTASIGPQPMIDRTPLPTGDDAAAKAEQEFAAQAAEAEAQAQANARAEAQAAAQIAAAQASKPKGKAKTLPPVPGLE
jgi:hypothetical protein